MNWWKIAQARWYHGTGRDFQEFDASKSDPSSAWGPGMYLTPDREDAEAWGRKGGGEPRIIEMPHPTGKVFPADGNVPVEDLQAIERLLGHERYSKAGQPVPGALVYMALERKLGDKAKVNAALRSIGYEGLTYTINRGREMQHMLRFAQHQPALYHGTAASFDKLKPNGYGIIWLTPDMTVAQQYASPSYAKGQPRVFKVTLKPNVRVVDLRNVEDPIVRKLMADFNAIRKVTYGSEISEQEWPKWADFGLLEVNGGQWTRWLKGRRVAAVTCSDSVLSSAVPHESVAVLSPAAIALQEVVA